MYSGSDDGTVKIWESGLGVINPPPQAAFTMNPNTGVAPLTVQLDASTSTDDGNIAKYQWASSDGQNAEGVKTSLKFSAAGNYDITLTVTDNKGATATKTQTITVNAATTEEPNKPTTEEPNQPTTEESDTTAQIEFENLKTFYKVGETLSVNLVQKVQTNRFQRVDLWAMIEMPSGKMIYNTPLPFAPFSFKPQAFQKSLETSSKKQKILDFEIPPGIGGSYVFYGIYLKEGSSLEKDGIMALRSNVAQKKLTLADK
ncbi:PKD domain-containing protein [Candidatus Marithrix sp. Canyon 246]|uniref:PKD domain-containing protein n=1 Tax=Candidatus Marithrix sp. Canyon 246 TaxID=1827136 RepID=UPI00084A12A2|nr:PKD domain-containing protein [Candidatus Marithrix sp. Canyon 246]